MLYVVHFLFLLFAGVRRARAGSRHRDFFFKGLIVASRSDTDASKLKNRVLCSKKHIIAYCGRAARAGGRPAGIHSCGGRDGSNEV